MEVPVILSLLATAALAWTPGDLRSREVPSAPVRVRVADWDGPVVVGTGPDGTWLVDGETWSVRAQGGPPAEDVLVRDLDGDDVPELLLCGSDGVSRLPVSEEGFGEPVRLTAEPCRAIGSFAREDGLGVVTADRSLALWDVVDGALDGPSRFGLAMGGVPVIAGDGARFAAVGRGDAEIVERSGFGRSTIAAGGPVGALVMGERSWVWTLPEARVLDDVTHRRVPLAADPGALAAADLDGDGRRDVLVAHPGRLGVVAAGATEERTFPVALSPSALAVGDLDGDGCGDVILAQPGVPVLGVMPGRCEEAVSEAPEAPPRRPAIDGQPRRDLPPPPKPVEEPPPPPTPSGERPTVVIPDEAPTVHATVGERLDVQLAVPEGIDAWWDARGGPPGLVVHEDGRVDYLPLARDVGSWRVTVRVSGLGGFVRARAFWVEVHEGTVEAMAPEEHPDDEEWSPRVVETYERSTFSIRACNASVGGGGALSGPTVSWEFLGEGVVMRGSPAIAFTCEGGGDQTRWFAGWDSAPMVEYIVDASTRGSHVVGVTGGVVFGGDVFRAGPYATAGVSLLGVGARAVYTPFSHPDIGRHGLEGRATFFTPSGPAGELLLLYTWQIGDYGP